MIILISADLKSNKSYEGFYDTITSAPLYWHYLERLWLVKTDESTKEWSNRLRTHIDESTDHIFVAEVDIKNYNGWLPKKAWGWIREHRDE
jgi:hypothetical protein